MMDQVPSWVTVTVLDDPAIYPLDEMKPVARFLLERSEQDRRRLIAAYDVHTRTKSISIDTNDFDFTKLYLLLRVLFDVPEEYPAGEAEYFGGWVEAPRAPPAREGMVNLLWPLGYQDGQLVLKAVLFYYRTPTYNGLAEYDYFTEHFPLRNVDELK